MAKSLSHTVKRPGRRHGEPDVEIPVAEDLATVPGIPQNPVDVAFYSREYPLETQSIDKSADRQWAWVTQPDDLTEFREVIDARMEPMYEAALVSGDIEPTGTPVPGEDLTDDIRRMAREIGFGEVGFTRYDRHYTFAGKKRWAKFEHAICLALEQDYLQTQSGPSLEAEYAHFGTYEIQQALCLKLADYLGSRGYHAQIHDGSDNSGPYIPLFVAAGLGQLGANGQLLSPHFGSRARLMLVTTDAPVTYDKPHGLRHPQVLSGVPGLRQPLPGARTGAGQGLVARSREEQANLRPLPPGNGHVPRLRGLHDSLPHSTVWDEARHGALRRYRRGPRKGHREPGRVLYRGQGTLRSR